MKRFYTLLFLCFASLNSIAQFDQIANGDFELWEEDTLYETPADWGSSNTEEFYGIPTVIKSSDAQDGSSSVEIKSVLLGQDTLRGYVFHGNLGQAGPDAGIAYTDNFEAVGIQYKSSLPAGDTLYLIMVRFNGGTIVDYKVIPAAYGNVNTWTPSLLYTGNIIQDELFIGFILGNPNGNSSPTPGAWALIDNVQLYAGSVTTTPLPNNSFESWTANTVENATSWYSLNNLLSAVGLENATKTTDANSGSFALEMTTHYLSPDTISSYLALAPIDLFSSNPFPNTPYNGSPARISGAYKYAPLNGDVAGIQITFFEAGNPVGVFYEPLMAQSNYTTFDYPITISGNPDSINFLVFSGNNPGSVLKIDDVQFLTADASINEDTMIDFKLYPNPAKEIVTLALPEVGNYKIEIASLDGKLQLSSENNSGNQHIDLNSIGAGIYLVHVSNSVLTETKRLIIR